MVLDKLKKYGKFAIPYIVFIDNNDIPHFKVNDNKKVVECINNDLCSVCGEKMNGDSWLIGGRLSAFHPHGAFVDIPVHKECGIYSLKNCPYMAYTRYTAKGLSEKEANELKNLGIQTFNPTMDNNRLQYFVFIKIRSFQVSKVSGNIYPEKPYLETEFWRDGEQITLENACELDPLLKELLK